MGDRREIWRWLAARLTRLRDGDDSAPVFGSTLERAHTFDADETALIETLPEEPAVWYELRPRVEALLDLHGTNGRTPHFANQLSSGVDDAGLAGALLGLASNATLSTREIAPLGTAIERGVHHWLLDYVGWDSGAADASATPGGSFSNYLALFLARKQACARHGDDAVPRLAVFTSRTSHYSITKGADLAGIPRANVIDVPTDADDRMVVEELDPAVERAVADGLIPCLVNATLGTTVAGVLDRVADAAEIARRHGAWMHVDAAWGAIGLVSSRAARFREGLEGVDSITWDAHKSSHAPVAVSYLLVRDRATLDVLRPDPERSRYLFVDDQQTEDEADLGLTSLYCGKPFLSLGPWLAWKTLGRSGVRAAADRAFELAEAFADRVSDTPGLHLCRRPETPVVCVRPDAPADVRDELARRMRDHLVADGDWMLRLCPGPDGRVFRAIFSNPRFERRHLDDLHQRLIDALRASE